MAEQKESSVLFSLKELMNLEEDRIKQEEASRRAQADAETQARLAAERRAREEEESRLRADDERRRNDEQRMREDQARVEAIRHAEVEKARIDAEHNARLESLRHQQEHERHMKALSQDKHKKQLTIAAVGAAILLIVGGITGGLALKNANDKAAADEARHQQELAEQKAQSDALQRQLEAQTQNISTMTEQLAAAKDNAAREALLKQIEEAKKAQASTQQRFQRVQSGGGGSTPSKTPRAACTCQAGDPLCSCIQ